MGSDNWVFPLKDGSVSFQELNIAAAAGIQMEATDEDEEEIPQSSPPKVWIIYIVLTSVALDNAQPK